MNLNFNPKINCINFFASTQDFCIVHQLINSETVTSLIFFSSE